MPSGLVAMIRPPADVFPAQRLYLRMQPQSTVQMIMTQVAGSASWLLVGDRRPGDRDDADEGVQAGEVGGVGRVQRQPLGDRGGGDHDVEGPASWLTACGDDGGCYAAEDACRLGVERH